MKRLFAISFFLFFVYNWGFAKKDDTHLLQMVQCINDSDFNCAQTELQQIKSWKNTTLPLSITKAIIFYDDITISDKNRRAIRNKNILLKLASFIAKEAKEQADYWNKKDKYKTAISYGEIALDFYMKAQMQKTIEYANALGDIGIYYDNMEDYQNAESYYSYAIQHFEEIGEVRELSYATYIYFLANIYFENDTYKEAHTLFSKAITVIRSSKKQKSDVYIYTLQALAHLLFMQGDNKEAEQFLMEAKNIAKSFVGENHIIYLDILRDLVYYYRNIGDEVNSQMYQEDVILSARDVYGSQSAEYGEEWKQYAIILYNKKMVEYSKKFFLKAADIIKGDIGEQNTSYIECLIYLGKINLEGGVEKDAEKYFTQAHNLIRQSDGDNSISYAYCLYLLGDYYLTTGYNDMAFVYFEKAAYLYEQLGKHNEDFASTLYKLGESYVQRNSYRKALTTILKCIALYEELNLTQSNIYANALQSASSIYAILNEPVLSQEYAQKAQDIAQSDSEKLEKEIQSIIESIQSFNKITNFNFSDEKVLSAMKLGIETLITSQVMLVGIEHGVMSDESVYTLVKLGNACAINGQPSAALPLAERCFAILKERISSTIEFMTEKQRKAFWDLYSYVFYEHFPRVSYYAHDYDSSAISFAYNNELFLKGILLRSSHLISNSILHSGDSTLIAQWNQLSLLKKEIVTLQERSPQSELLNQITQESEDLEKQITVSSAEFRNNAILKEITCDSVRQVLRPNQVAIEYMSVPLAPDSIIYYALLLRDTYSSPIMIPLFMVSQDFTQLLLSALGDQEAIRDLYAHDKIGISFSQIIWGNVQPFLHTNDEIYFSPTGVLHQIAIENLPYDSIHTIGDIYNMVRLSSTRDLVLHKQSITPTSAALFGGINYDATPEDLYAHRVKPIEDEEDKQPDNTLIAYNTKKDRDSKGPLPGTKIEVREIDKVLTEANVHVQCDTAEIATEEAFKALSGKHKHIIHLATHGFYWQDSIAQNEKYFTQRAITMDNTNAPKSIDPLERCGLLFAGANTTLEGEGEWLEEYGVQDGVLTAKEISNMDLRDAELIVLSACETGLGDITGDGVFGLQRAFKMAGAKTIIMSLWKVDDNATQLLMTEFYKNWITSKGKLSKREAFHKAQNVVRSQYNNPVDWAGFIILD